jgi:hypothetical protein
MRAAPVAGDGCTGSQTQGVAVNGNLTVDFSLPQRHVNFGYACQLVAFSYVDGDTSLASLTGDDVAVAVSLPFPFTFYGQGYNTANVCTNGFLNFLASNTTFTNDSIPGAALPNGSIYPFWDDLFMDASSSAWTKLTGLAPNRAFTVEYRNVGFFGDLNHRVNFEVTLNENGQILTQYKNVGSFDVSRRLGDDRDEKPPHGRAQFSTNQSVDPDQTRRSGTATRRDADSTPE